MGHTSEFPFISINWWTFKNLKNQNFEKMKTIAGDIIILHMCIKNHNHIRYSFWDRELKNIILKLYNKKDDHTMYVYSDTECDIINFLSFYAIFCSLPHHWPQK